MGEQDLCPAFLTGGKNAGARCQRETEYGFEYCRIHFNSITKHGPYAAKYAWKKAEYNSVVRILLDYYMKGLLNYAQYSERICQEDTVFQNSLEALKQRYPDGAQTNYYRRMNERRRQRARELRWQAVEAQQRVERQNPNEDLNAFANDNQNVHTTIVVNQTVNVVNKIREIPVPEDFRWNKDKCSKTPADIILHCELTPTATFQMMSKYCSDETIYDMDEGVYGKTLDSVWQYILNSEDKECLIRTLKQEMEDNIGMCAQGNLSRLCNILAGYIDDVVPVENVSDVLGRLFPPLLDIPDVDTRIETAKNILKNVGLPPDRWNDWLESVIE
jgi:hypothetical protein